MKLRYISAAIALVFLLMLLSGCSEPVLTGYPVVCGGITFGSTPKRVVSLTPGITESLYILGYGGRIVGVSSHCDRPQAAVQMPSCGSPLEPDFETIYELHPDIIITGAELTRDALGIFEEMGIPVLTLPWAADVQQLLKNQYDLLTIFAGELRAPALIEQLTYYADVQTAYVCESVKSYLAQIKWEPSAVYMAKMDFVLATGDTLEGRLLEQMGLINQAAPYTGWNYPPEDEPDLNPDIIFYGEDVSPDAMLESPYYKQTAAVTQERVYPVDLRGFERRSILLFSEMEQMALSAFPEAFSSPKPSLIPPVPEEPEVEPKWYDFIVDWLDSFK